MMWFLHALSLVRMTLVRRTLVIPQPLDWFLSEAKYYYYRFRFVLVLLHRYGIVLLDFFWRPTSMSTSRGDTVQGFRKINLLFMLAWRGSKRNLAVARYLKMQVQCYGQLLSQKANFSEDDLYIHYSFSFLSTYFNARTFSCCHKIDSFTILLW